MKLKLLALLCVGVVILSGFARERKEETFIYNDHDHSVVHEEMDGRYDDSDTLILLEESAGLTDTLLAEERSQDENLPIYHVNGDEFDYGLLKQDRRKMYVYGVISPSVLEELESNGFRNMGW